MGVIQHPRPVDAQRLAEQLQPWFAEHSFETKVSREDAATIVTARKRGVVRTAVGASRALEISIVNSGDATRVEIRQGKWKRNLIGPGVMLLYTLGASALIPGWSLVLQKQLESHIRTLLGPVGPVARDVPSQLEIIDVVETDRAEQAIGNDVRLIDNSRSAATGHRKLKFTKRWIQTCVVDVDRTEARGLNRELVLKGLASFKQNMEESIRRRYSMTTEVEHTFEDEVTLDVAPHTAMELTIHWKRLLQRGRVYVTERSSMQTYEVPFELVTGLTFDQSQVDVES